MILDEAVVNKLSEALGKPPHEVRAELSAALKPSAPPPTISMLWALARSFRFKISVA